jgi:hypothetical protein
MTRPLGDIVGTKGEQIVGRWHIFCGEYSVASESPGGDNVFQALQAT